MGWKKLVNGIYFASSAFGLRGHNLKLRRESVKKCSPRYDILTKRMVNYWNSLPTFYLNKNELNFSLRYAYDKTWLRG